MRQPEKKKTLNHVVPLGLRGTILTETRDSPPRTAHTVTLLQERAQNLITKPRQSHAELIIPRKRHLACSTARSPKNFAPLNAYACRRVEDLV